YFLIVSELVPYKRLDSAVRHFASSGRKLKIAGDGPEYGRLRKMAGPNVEFCGRVPDEQLRTLYARCRAFLMPGEEDFGITIVEAIASGKAVVGLGRGGILEIVPPDGAFFYDSPQEESLAAALRKFDSAVISPEKLQAAARKFSRAEFNRKMREVLY